jgi:hypothetical protein
VNRPSNGAFDDSRPAGMGPLSGNEAHHVLISADRREAEQKAESKNYGRKSRALLPRRVTPPYT